MKPSVGQTAPNTTATIPTSALRTATVVPIASAATIMSSGVLIKSEQQLQQSSYDDNNQQESLSYVHHQHAAYTCYSDHDYDKQPILIMQSSASSSSFDDHVFKTPNKPAPSTIATAAAGLNGGTTPVRKRKVSGTLAFSTDNSSNSSFGSSPRSGGVAMGETCGGQQMLAQQQRPRAIPGIFAALSSGNVSSVKQNTKVAAATKLTKHRYETSLGQLTKKFINLLKQAPEGVSSVLS